MKPLSPTQRIRRWSLFLWLWRVHRWMGLALGAVIVLLSLTGSLLVMHHELEIWIHPERHAIPAPPAGASRAPVVPLLQALQAEAPAGYRPLRIEPGHGITSADKIVFVSPDRVHRWSALVNPWTGGVLWRGADQSLLTPWLLHLHMHLQAGKWGYVVTGLAAIALTLLGITGLWITRDHLTTLLRRPFRLNRGWRVAASDLHKWTGLASIYFTLVLGATGVWFAILIVPQHFSADFRPPLGPPFDLSRLTVVEAAVATTEREFPGTELTRVIFPWDTGIKLQVRVLHRDAPIWAKQSRMEFDPVTGEHVRTVRASEATTAQKWSSILSPLHFGYFGSPLVKWLYVIGGAMPAVLAITGTTIWCLRRKKRATPSSRSSAGRSPIEPAFGSSP